MADDSSDPNLLRSDDTEAPSGVASGRLAVGSARMLPRLFAAERPSPSARERIRMRERRVRAGLGFSRCRRPVLDHADLTAGGVEAHLVHEGADEQEAAAADPRQVFGLDGAVEEGCIEAR